MTDFGAPILHHARHEDGGADELDCAGLAGRHQYVDRGDPSNYDWVRTDLTTDGTWNDLDLSSIVPAGTVAVSINLIVTHVQTNMAVALRKKGNTNDINVLTAQTRVSMLSTRADGIVPCDANRFVQYNGTNTTFIAITILVRGWFV